jgi:hypothetical protein
MARSMRVRVPATNGRAPHSPVAPRRSPLTSSHEVTMDPAEGARAERSMKIG